MFNFKSYTSVLAIWCGHFLGGFSSKMWLIHPMHRFQNHINSIYFGIVEYWELSNHWELPNLIVIPSIWCGFYFDLIFFSIYDFLTMIIIAALKFEMFSQSSLLFGSMFQCQLNVFEWFGCVLSLLCALNASFSPLSVLVASVFFSVHAFNQTHTLSSLNSHFPKSRAIFSVRCLYFTVE